MVFDLVVEHPVERKTPRRVDRQQYATAKLMSVVKVLALSTPRPLMVMAAKEAATITDEPSRPVSLGGALSCDKTASGLSILATCTTDVKLWFMQKGLQLNADKSETLIMGTV